jgi:hypothetical protein
MTRRAITTLVALSLSLGGVGLGLAGCGGGGSGGTIVPTPTPTPTPIPTPPPPPPPPPPTPTPTPGAPTFTKSFGTDRVELRPNARTTLTYTITNTTDRQLTGLAFFDSLLAGLVVANPSNFRNGCGGTLAAAPGATAISLVNGSLAANANCTISVDLQVTATTLGVLTSPAVTLTGNQAPAATAPAINLTVTVPAPTFTMAFTPNPLIFPGGGVLFGTLTFTITNNATIPLTRLAFNHTLPAGAGGGLQITGAGAATTCAGATLTALAGATTIRFTGGRVEPGQTCIVAIPVQTAGGVPPGVDFTYLNAPVTLTSNEAASVTTGPVIWTVQT